MELNWRKSSRSSQDMPKCVELALVPDGGVAVRDSKNETGPVLHFPGNPSAVFGRITSANSTVSPSA